MSGVPEGYDEAQIEAYDLGFATGYNQARIEAQEAEIAKRTVVVMVDHDPKAEIAEPTFVVVAGVADDPILEFRKSLKRDHDSRARRARRELLPAAIRSEKPQRGKR